MSCFSSFLKVCVRRLAKCLQLSSGGSLKFIGPKWSHTCSRKDTCGRKEDDGLGFQDLDTVLQKKKKWIYPDAFLNVEIGCVGR